MGENEETFKEKKEWKNEENLSNNFMNVENETPYVNRYTCRLCGGDICLGQPFLGPLFHNGARGHAICLAGYGGEKYEYYPRRKAESYWKPNFFGKCILEIFKKYKWLNTYTHMDLIWEELEKRMGNIQYRNEYFFVRQMKLLNFDIASWHEEFEGKTVYWYIQRKNWRLPGNVYWQRYITEILKAKHAIPVARFCDDSNKVKPIIPHKLLDFIRQYTRCADFEEALIKHMPGVEIFHQYSDAEGKRVKMMRLRNVLERLPKWESCRFHKEKTGESIQTTECNPEFDERKNENFNYTDDILFEFNVFQDSKKSSPIKNPLKI